MTPNCGFPAAVLYPSPWASLPSWQHRHSWPTWTRNQASNPTHSKSTYCVIACPIKGEKFATTVPAFWIRSAGRGKRVVGRLSVRCRERDACWCSGASFYAASSACCGASSPGRIADHAQWPRTCGNTTCGVRVSSYETCVQHQC